MTELTERTLSPRRAAANPVPATRPGAEGAAPRRAAHAPRVVTAAGQEAGRNRLDWVDTGRGIAILLVALYHSARWLPVAGFHTQGWQEVNGLLATLRMPLFFTLSGLFARKWLHASWRALLSTKVLLFGWVFLVWETVGSVAFVGGTAVDGHRVSLWDTGVSLLLSPLIPKLELWFIWALALFFVMAKLLRRVPPVVQLIVAGSVSAVSLTVWVDSTTGLTGAAKYFAFFLGGIYLRSLVLKVGAASTTRLGLYALTWLVVAVGSTLLGWRELPGVYFVSCLCGVVGGIAFSRALSRVSLLGWIGRRTLPIYLAHTPVIITLAFFWVVAFGHRTASGQDVFGTPVVAALAVTIALGLHAAAEHSPLIVLYEPPRRLLSRCLAVATRRSGPNPQG